MERLRDQVGKKTGDKCTQCGGDMIYTDGLGLYSCPPCTKIHCKECLCVETKSYRPAESNPQPGLATDLMRGLPVFEDRSN